MLKLLFLLWENNNAIAPLTRLAIEIYVSLYLVHSLLWPKKGSLDLKDQLFISVGTWPQGLESLHLEE